MKIFITSGGCKVPIDDVRHIGNFSSGRYGAELGDLFVKSEKEVIFFHEKHSKFPAYLNDNGEVNPVLIPYKDYYEYLKVKDLIRQEQPDIIISAAAVSDYVVDKTEGKISSKHDTLTIKLKKGEKVLKSFRDLTPHAYIVGFKLLVDPTEVEINTAVDKVFDSGVNAVVYNNLSDLRNGITERRLYYSRDRGERGYTICDAETLVEEILVESSLFKIFKT
tara:strand:- start:23864 stop:24526 length:663 start_codon:yes stop_codon:yes gene_type:complete